MRASRFSNLIRIVFNTVTIIVVAFTNIGLFLDFLINQGKTARLYIVALIFMCFSKALMECLIALLDRFGRCSVIFYSDYIVYRTCKYYIDELTFRYFRFEWTFLETDLVIPKLVISFSNGEHKVFYISKRQLRKLKNELKYSIIEI